MRRTNCPDLRLLPISSLALGALLLLLSGCRNPFVPQSEVQLMQLTGSNDVPEIAVLKVTGGTLGENEFDKWKVYAHFLVSNRVGVSLSRVNIVYTNMLGQEITTYRSSGGKSYKILARLAPYSSQSFQLQSSYGWGIPTTIPVFVVDNIVYTELTTSDVIIAHVTFWGEDDNGYDIKLSSQITIKGYSF